MAIDDQRVVVVVAGQLDDVRANIFKQLNIFRVAAEEQAWRGWIGEGAVFVKRDLVAEVGQVCLSEPVADILAGVGDAVHFHAVGRTPDEGGYPRHDQGGHPIRVSVGALDSVDDGQQLAILGHHG